MADGGGADAREFSAAGSGSFSAHSSRDKAFEIFVKRTITSIQKEAWGRSKEVKEIREACQSFLNSLDQTGVFVWWRASRLCKQGVLAPPPLTTCVVVLGR